MHIGLHSNAIVCWGGADPGSSGLEIKACKATSEPHHRCDASWGVSLTSPSPGSLVQWPAPMPPCCFDAICAVDSPWPSSKRELFRSSDRRNIDANASSCKNSDVGDLFVGDGSREKRPGAGASGLTSEIVVECKSVLAVPDVLSRSVTMLADRQVFPPVRSTCSGAFIRLKQESKKIDSDSAEARQGSSLPFSLFCGLQDHSNISRVITANTSHACKDKCKHRKINNVWA